MVANTSYSCLIYVLLLLLRSRVTLSTKAYQCNLNNPRISDECMCFPSSSNLSPVTFECKEPDSESSFLVDYVHQYSNSENQLDIQCPCPTQLQPSLLFDYISDAFIIDKSSQVHDLKLNHCPFPSSGLSSVIEKWTTLMSVHRLTYRICYREISSNQTLPTGTFHKLTELKILDLEKNNLESLSANVFENLPHLTSLSLGENKLTTVKKLFRNLTSLKYLLLGSNFIQELEIDTFEDLKNLVQLNLQDNQLQHIPEVVFVTLTNLSKLDLSKNQIRDLPDNVFFSNLKLKELGLERNHLTSVPRQLLHHNTQLLRLSLYGNRNLSELPSSLFIHTTLLRDLDLNSCNLSHASLSEDVFYSLKELRKLNLASNRLEILEENWFLNLSNLQELNLSRNRLQQVNAASFKTLTNLSTLDLSSNEIEAIAASAFVGLNKLQVLILDGNRLTRLSADHGLSSPFIGISNLQELYLRNNLLTDIDISTMEPLIKLKKVDLSLNKLVLNNSHISPFNRNLRLEWIDLSHNNLVNFFSDLGASFINLAHLNLSHNNLTVFAFDDLPNYNHMKLDLSNNRIVFVDFRSAQLTDVDSSGSYKKLLLLSNNPLNCNCNAFYLAQYMNRTLPGVAHSWTIEPRSLTCMEPPDLRGSKVVQVDPMHFLCPCREDTSPCQCHQRPADNSMLLDCQQKDLISLDHPLPTHPGLKMRLNLSSNRIDPRRINGINFRQVTHLDLSKNHLQSSALFDSINWTTLFQETLPNLVQLDLRYNDLVSVPPSVIDIWNGSREVRLELSGNPWSCDCDNMHMINFIYSSFGRVDYNQITCQDGTLLSRMNRDVCNSLDRAVIVSVIVLPLVAFFTAVASFVMLYRYRRTLRAWLYTHKICMSCVFQEEESDDDDRPYDAFVSYSHKDEEFITKHLVPNLERPDDGPSYRLCLHYRDWLAGQWIPDQIQQSVARSKRTLIILSDHFLESLWGQLEFRTAYQQVMQDRKMRLIIIVLGDLPSKEKMDNELSRYLSLNTFLKWGDPWFWDRLRYALPHKKIAYQGRKTRIANAVLNNGDTMVSKADSSSNIKLELPPLPLPATPADQSQIALPQTPTSSASSTAPLFPAIPA